MKGQVNAAIFFIAVGLFSIGAVTVNSDTHIPVDNPLNETGNNNTQDDTTDQQNNQDTTEDTTDNVNLDQDGYISEDDKLFCQTAIDQGKRYAEDVGGCTQETTKLACDWDNDFTYTSPNSCITEHLVDAGGWIKIN
jgi:hypothetical protein